MDSLQIVQTGSLEINWFLKPVSRPREPVISARKRNPDLTRFSKAPRLAAFYSQEAR